MNIINNALVAAFGDIEQFSKHILKRPLRRYQVEPARVMIASIIRRDGEHYVWRFPRQSGKNETIAHVTAYALFLYQRTPGSTIIHTAPTYDPQAANAQRRVMEITANSPFFTKLKSTENHIVLGEARAVFLSGGERDKPNVGSVASLALIKDEAQDLSQPYIEQAFDPMTANTNAPHLHTGTARMLQTYLTAKRKELEKKTKRDKKQRIWAINWRDVAAENPAYGQMVSGLIDTRGTNHPTIITEFENIENDDTANLFNPRRTALIFAPTLTRLIAPIATERYAITVDVGGTSIEEGNRQHDPTLAAIHHITITNNQPTLQTVAYWMCTGDVLNDTPHRKSLFSLITQWKPSNMLVDATGLGIGLANALTAQFGAAVRHIIWSESTKTQALEEYLALIETGRYQHYAATTDEDLARIQMQMAKINIRQRGRYYSYGVDDSATWLNPFTQKLEPLHDDHLMTSIMTGLLANIPPPATITQTKQQRPNRQIKRQHHE